MPSPNQLRRKAWALEKPARLDEPGPCLTLRPGNYTFNERQYPKHGHRRIYLKALMRDPCPYCGGESTTKEHVHPRAKGGGNSTLNLVGACAACNEAKASKKLIFYLLDR